jgi:hypothetical protein
VYFTFWAWLISLNRMISTSIHFLGNSIISFLWLIFRYIYTHIYMCAFVISVSKSSNQFAEKTSFYLVSLIDISMFWITVVCIFHMLNFANLVIVLGFFFSLNTTKTCSKWAFVFWKDYYIGGSMSFYYKAHNNQWCFLDTSNIFWSQTRFIVSLDFEKGDNRIWTFIISLLVGILL